jgi:hypothetical protein
MKNLVKKRIQTKAPVIGVEEKVIILQLVTLQNILKDIISNKYSNNYKNI